MKGKFIETQSEIEDNWEERWMECFVLWIYSLWDNEKVLEMFSGDGYITSWMYLMLSNYSIKMVKMIHLWYVYFTAIYTKRKKKCSDTFPLESLPRLSPWKKAKQNQSKIPNPYI